MIEVILNDVIAWTFMLPLTINFLANLCYTKKLNQSLFSHYCWVNLLFLIGCFYMIFVANNLNPKIFNVEFFVLYAIFVEVYLFHLAGKLNN